jgi:hypothetical protein
MSGHFSISGIIAMGRKIDPLGRIGISGKVVQKAHGLPEKSTQSERSAVPPQWMV